MKALITILVVGLIALAAWWYLGQGTPATPTNGDNSEPVNGPAMELPAASAARTQAAADAGVAYGDTEVISAVEQEWPDACLGLAGADEMCAQVITTGYEVVVSASGETYTYRTNFDGSVVRRAQ
ncbi:hypothetical protein COU20_02585 [Candidatus Kaiserbacteria bacterium CG10_big_fil_rev_8_21_14_0_10_59_10]|uniref:Uncharacterized protein n=1 Tax=Candidatus Kaiserbacteria bacterium CG10_big_fil_rev_8_21_14_0_10_59_10 TaxID=1974612 RepID=A0A2H0U9M3_9BACT|nr:MAG: hypothetical protein COU20_02585 [Candidatus Kaiserbacteria bacterium CG10_big_fil_rev_8_21_14_0_10_59_10]